MNKAVKDLENIKYYIPTIVFLCIIFYFSSQPGVKSNSSSNFVIVGLSHMGINLAGTFGENIATTIVRKGGHITEYIILYILILWGLNKNGVKKSSMIGVIFVFFFACFDEVHQRFVPQREGKFLDVLIDMSGVILLVVVKKIYNYISLWNI